METSRRDVLVAAATGAAALAAGAPGPAAAGAPPLRQHCL